MGLPPGRTNNPNGKPKGTQNKMVEKFRSDLLIGLMPELPEYLKELRKLKKTDPLKALEIYHKYLTLVLPKMKEIDLSGDISFNPVQIEIIDGQNKG